MFQISSQTTQAHRATARVRIVCSLVACLLFVTLVASADAQQNTRTSADPNSPQGKVDTAFELSKTAKSSRDYITMIELLGSAIQSDGLPDAKRRYSERLKGWAHNRRGELLAKAGKERAAAIQFEEAVLLNSKHWKARYNRGLSFAIEGEIDKAIDDFTISIEGKRTYAQSWFNRGEAYYTRGDLREALRDYSEAIKLDRENAGYYSVRGFTYHRLGQHAKAVADYDRSIEFDEKNPVPYVYRGDTFAEFGQYAEAARDYRKAVDLDDQLPRVYQSIAWLMATCPDKEYRDVERGLAAATKAIELQGDSADYRFFETLAAAHANAGDFSKARKSQQKAIGMAPNGRTNECKQRLDWYQDEKPYRQAPRTAKGLWGPRQAM